MSLCAHTDDALKIVLKAELRAVFLNTTLDPDIVNQ